MLIEPKQVAELKTSLKMICSILKGSEALVVLDMDRGLLYGQDSDLDIAIATPYLKAIVDVRDFRIRVDAKKLHSILTHSRSATQLEVVGRVLEVQFGSSRFELPTTAAPPPPLKDFKSPLAVPASALVPVLRQALTVAAGGMFGSVLVANVNGVGLRAVATDGLRLIVADQAGGSSVAPQLSEGLLISQRAAEAICELPGDTFHIFTDETSLVVDTGTARLVARRTSAKFPEYEKVIPVDIKREYTVKAEDMLASLDRLSSVLDTKQADVTLTLMNETAHLTVPGAEDTIPLSGKSNEPNFDVDFDVIEDRLRFRHSFLATFFQIVKGDVHIKIEDPKRPVLFEAGPLKFIMASALVPTEK